MFLASAAAAMPVSTQWKLAAVGIAAGFLVFLYVVISALSGDWNPLKLARGTDGPLSTSKFQWLLWLVTVLFVYVALLVIRFKLGNYGAINSIPVNVLVVLGFSTTTAVAAKGITVTQVQNNQVDKSQSAGGLLLGDQGDPDIGKVQMVAFTFVAIGVYIATFVHQLASNPPTTILPNIDASLLVLMGISQGGYLGKKLVSVNSAVLYGLISDEVEAGDPIGLTGSNLGGTQDGSQLTLDNALVPAGQITSWSDKSIGFTVPARDIARSRDWEVAQKVSVQAIVSGQSTNSLTFTVNPPALTGADPPAAAPGAEVTINGRYLGTALGQLSIDGGKVLQGVAWASTKIVLKVPARDPANNKEWLTNQKVSIAVVVNGHTSNAVDFTVMPAKSAANGADVEAPA